MTVIAPTEPHGTQTPTVVPPSRSPRVRVAWTVAGLVVAIAIIPALALTLIGSAAYQPLPARQRVFTVPITAVTVETSSGNITVERGTGVGTVVRTSGVHGLTDPTDVEHVVGHTLVIRSSCGSMFFNDRCSRNYVLQLPSAAAVTAESTQGDVTIAGTERSVSAHSDQGDVTVTGGTGTVQASSGQGNVTISRSAATSVSATSGQGDVVVELTVPPNRVSASSGQGDVTVELPRGPNFYQVQATSGQGNVSNTVGDDPASVRVVRATSGQGDVTVRYRSP